MSDPTPNYRRTNERERQSRRNHYIGPLSADSSLDEESPRFRREGEPYQNRRPDGRFENMIISGPGDESEAKDRPDTPMTDSDAK